jgi:hypothetical protein
MARIEEDREDLMRDATALVRRMEIQIDGQEDPIFIGYKRSDYLSIYLSQDLVYHFDNYHQLRRAFVKPFLYRSEGDSLTRLARARTESTSELHSAKLSDEELNQFQLEMHNHLSSLHDALNANQFKVIQQIPEEDDITEELKASLKEVLSLNGKLSPAIVKR